MNLFRTAALVLAATAGVPSAQGFKGAEIDVSSTASTEFSDVGIAALQGSIEFGLTERFAFAADIGSSLRQPDEQEGASATLHAIYDLSPNSSLGLYLASDDLSGFVYNSLGVEAGFGINASEFEVFAGTGDFKGLADFSILGFDGSYRFGQRFAATTSFADLAFDNDLEQSRFGIGAEARLGSVSTLYLEVGEDNLEGVTAGYVGIGARFVFGPNGGTTFDPRGVVEVFGGL